MKRHKYLNSTANTREARMDRILSFSCLASNSPRCFLLADYAGGVHALTMTQSTWPVFRILCAKWDGNR